MYNLSVFGMMLQSTAPPGQGCVFLKTLLKYFLFSLFSFSSILSLAAAACWTPCRWEGVGDSLRPKEESDQSPMSQEVIVMHKQQGGLGEGETEGQGPRPDLRALGTSGLRPAECPPAWPPLRKEPTEQGAVTWAACSRARACQHHCLTPASASHTASPPGQ